MTVLKVGKDTYVEVDGVPLEHAADDAVGRLRRQLKASLQAPRQPAVPPSAAPSNTRANAVIGHAPPIASTTALPEAQPGDGPRDPVFHSPASDRELVRWLRRTGTLGTVRLADFPVPEQSTVLRDIDSRWRARPVDVAGFIAHAIALATRQPNGGGTGIAEHLAAAKPFLLPAWQSHAVIGGEPVPAELLRDRRLPFPQTLAVLGARFELPHRILKELSGLRTGPVSYRPALVQARDHGASLLGLLYTADTTHKPDGRVGYLLGIHEAAGLASIVLVPGDTAGQLANVAEQIGAFLHLRATIPPRRALRAAARHPAAAQLRTGVRFPSTVHVIDVPKAAPRARRSSFLGYARSPHVRRAHWHRYRIGPQDDWHYEWRWIPPTWVNGAGPPDDRFTVYKLH